MNSGEAAAVNMWKLKKLIEYLDIRALNYNQNKFGVIWIFMEKKHPKFAEGLGINDFKALPCWISDTLKRNKKFWINMHGEVN